jgi:trimeric autotransporter adhesin
MAIKFLSNVDIQGSLTLNDNQLTNFVVENLTSDPSFSNSFVGRLYYNNSATPGTLKVCVEVNSGTNVATYVSLDSTDGVNTFSSGDGTASTGAAITANSSATGGVTANVFAYNGGTNIGYVPSGGGNTTFLRGDGTWVVPTNSGGTVTGVSGTAPIVSDGSSTTPTISISAFGGADGTSAGSKGAVPAPAATDNVKFLRGDGTFATPSGSYTSWTLAGSTGSTAISDGDTATFSGGTYITTAEVSGTLTITHDATSRNDTSSTDTVNSGETFTKVDSITTNATGHVTAINLETITMGAFDDYGSWTLAGDGGTSQTISSGNTATIAGGTNIGTTASATDTVTVNLDDSITLSGDLEVQGGDITTSAATTTFTIKDDEASALTFSSSGSANLLKLDTTASEGVSVTGLFSVSGAATLTGGFSAGAESAMGSNKITGLATGTATGDATNLGQVQALVAGVGVFQGAYDASTNSPALSGASNVALTTGDYFVVSVDGTNSVLGVLEVGDLIFANNDITASSSPAISNYTVVRQDANIAGANTTDATTEKGVSGFDSAFFDVSVNGWVQIKADGIPLGTNTSGDYVATIAASTVAGDEGISTTGTGESAAGVIGLDITGLTDIGTSIAATDEFVVYNGTNNLKVDYSTIASNVHDSGKFSDTYPTSDNNTWTVTHGLGTTQVLVQTWLETGGQAVYIDFVRTDANNVSFTASSTITADTIRVLVTK